MKKIAVLSFLFWNFLFCLSGYASEKLEIQIPDFEKILALQSPTEKAEWLDRWSAYYSALLDRKSVNQESVHFNLALVAFRQKKYGEALFHANQIRENDKLLAQARAIKSKVVDEIGLTKPAENKPIDIFLEVVSLRILTFDQKWKIAAIFNGLFFLFLCVYLVMRKRGLLQIVSLCFLAGSYFALTAFFPGLIPNPQVGYVIASDPPVSSKPGEFFKEDGISLKDGYKVRILSSKQDWVEFEWNGEIFWTRDSYLIF